MRAQDARPSAPARLAGVALISGDEPVSTDALTAMLVAIRDNTSDAIETATIIARDAEDDDKIVDLSPAIAGLPNDITPLWDGGLTLSRADLCKPWRRWDGAAPARARVPAVRHVVAGRSRPRRRGAGHGIPHRPRHARHP